MSESLGARLNWPPLSRQIIAIGVTLLILRLAMVIAAPLKGLVSAQLLLGSANVTQLKLWVIATHALWPTDFGALFFDMFALYLFGGALEQRWSRSKWWVAVALSILFGGALAALSVWLVPSATLIGGFGAPVMGFVAAYCVEHWRSRLNFFFVELSGKTLLAFFVGLDLLFALLNANPQMLALHLGGVAAGALVAHDLYHPKRLVLHFKYWKIRRNLKVIAKTPEANASQKRRKDGQWIN